MKEEKVAEARDAAVNKWEEFSQTYHFRLKKLIYQYLTVHNDRFQVSMKHDGDVFSFVDREQRISVSLPENPSQVEEKDHRTVVMNLNEAEFIIEDFIKECEEKRSLEERRKIVYDSALAKLTPEERDVLSV